MQFALNQMSCPRLAYKDFLALAAQLGCIGVEVRNDLDRALFDGADPLIAGQMARDNGLRLLGLSQVYPFNCWSPEIEAEVRALVAIAVQSGAETISLIPRNDRLGQTDLQAALAGILPLVRDTGVTALIEPLGFQRSTLRLKADLVAAIDAIGGQDHFKLVHDTFHHTLANEGLIYPQRTGIVHISGVIDLKLPVDEMEDAHRVMVTAEDRLDNIGQLKALIAAGFDGPISLECFAPEVHALEDPDTEIKRSFDFISARLEAIAA